MLESVTIYTLNNENMYEQLDMKTSIGVLKSKVLDAFTVNLKDIF